MTTLYLLRHAKSSWDDPDLDDRDRPLAPRGEKAARRVAAYLSRRSVRPDVILCSPATRARQTLDAVVAAMEPPAPPLIEDALYGAGASQLLARLQRLDDGTASALMVGHNPGLQDLAVLLAGGGDADALARMHEKFPTGALATLTSGVRWAELGPSAARLDSLVVSRQLER